VECFEVGSVVRRAKIRAVLGAQTKIRGANKNTGGVRRLAVQGRAESVLT